MYTTIPNKNIKRQWQFYFPNEVILPESINNCHA